ncbi:11353_t:CDS:2, partial [Dentiscutata heterogama]
STNAAEAAHAMSNREGKQLKLLTAILNTSQISNKRLKKSQKNEEIDLTNDEITVNKDNSKEMSQLEKLDYEERLLQLEERKERLKELCISNLIKEREYGLEN